MASFTLGAVVAARAQEAPPPYPLPSDDELDPQGRTSTVLGSGARALGMGGAFLARADDATAASWNPAGLSYLRRPEISVVGARSSFSKHDFALRQDDYSRGTGPDFASFAYPFFGGSYSGAVQLSFQRAISLDYSRDLNRPEAGATTTRLRNSLESEGGFDVIALGTGLRLSKHVRIGATYNHWFSRFALSTERRRSVTPGERTPDPAARQTESDVLTKMSLRGWNLNLGIVFSPIETLNMGWVLKTPFTSSGSLFRMRTDRLADGSVTQQSKIRPGRDGCEPGAESTPRLINLCKEVELDWPKSVGFGVSWRPFSTLTLAADVTTTNWSKAQLRNHYLLRRPETSAGQVGRPNPDAFDYGLIRNPDPTATRPGLPLPYPNVDLVGTKLQRDAHQFRFGAEYVIFARSVRWPVRIGFFRDEQSFPASVVRNASTQAVISSTPPPVFHGITFGAGIVAGDVLFDAAHIYEWGGWQDGRTTFRTRSHRTLLSLIYRFGEPR